MNSSNDFYSLISKFFSSYLRYERGYSTNTIKSYRDSFLLLIHYTSNVKHVQSESLKIEDLKVKHIRSFLNWLRENKNYTNSSINNRLASIKSFFKFLQFEDLRFLEQAQQILSIPIRRISKKTFVHLTVEQIQFLISQTDIETRVGFRDATILSTLFDTGARVQEIIDLTPSSFRFDDTPTVKIKGKGDKERVVLLTPPEAFAVKRYIMKNGLEDPALKRFPLFKNRSGRKFTRAGLSYIVKKYALKANEKDPNFPIKISCHTFRHSKAMALVKQGVPLIYVRDQLGHESIKTTETYGRADNEYKRIAIENAYLDILPPEKPRWEKNPGIIEFLKKF